MKEKIFKTIVVCILIMTLTMFDFITLGQHIVIAMDDSTTNIRNVDFSVHFNEKSNIQQGDSLIFNIEVKETGVLKNGKIKIENANFNFQPIQDQYIKNINTDTNEIELNEMTVGNRAEISVPIKFKVIEEMNKNYISQETKVQLTGDYQNNQDEKKEAYGEKNIRITWEEEEQVTLEQEIEKFVDLEENSTLIQQKISSQITNNTLVSQKTIETIVPEVENTLPEKVSVLINGNLANEGTYTYDAQSKMVTIQNVSNEEKDEYKIIYNYAKCFEETSFVLPLSSKIKVSLYTEEVVEKEDVRQVEASKTDNAISVSTMASNNIYKGYLYANSDRNTQYQEKMNIELSTLKGIDRIQIGKMKDYFVDQNQNQYASNQSTYIGAIKFNKENLEKILGNEFSIHIVDENDQILREINNASELAIPIENGKVESIRILTNEPISIGTLTIEMDRYIKGTGYSKEQLKTFTNLENTKVVSIGEKEILAANTVALEDTCSEAKIELSNTELSTMNQNENVQILATLKSDSEKYDLYKNPYLEIKFPEELQEITVNTVNILHAEEMQCTKAIYGEKGKAIQIQLEGEQTEFKTAVEEGIQISIDANLTFQKNIPNKKAMITMLYKNENANEPQYETSSNINLNSKYGAILYNNISGYNDENTVLESTDKETIQAQLDLETEEKQAVINQSLINNYDAPIDEITVIGNLVGKNSNFETELIQNIATSSENAKVYYSNKKEITQEDSSWQENPENLQEMKSYKIELNQELQPSETMNMNYQIDIPAQLEEGIQNYQTTNINYLYKGQPLSTSSTIQLYTENKAVGITKEEDGIKTEIVAMSANKELVEGEEIFEGQPISYQVKITNQTGEDLNNFKLVAEHTNAIYYVEQEQKGDIPDYDIDENGQVVEPPMLIFTRKDENAANVTKTAETIKNSETATFTYVFSPKKKEGTDILGTIKISADQLEEKTIPTITNKIKDAEVAIEVINNLEENANPFEKEIIPFKFNMTNYSQEDKKDVVIKIQTSDEISCIDEVEFLEAEWGFEVLACEKNTVTLKIPQVKANETLTFNIMFVVNELNADQAIHNASIYYTAQVGDTTYFSNTLTREVERVSARIAATQSANVSEKIVNAGDKIIYTAEIANNDSVLDANNLELEHEVTEGNAKIEKAYLQKANGEIIEATIEGTNQATAEYDLKAGEKIRYIAEVLVWENPDEEVNYEDSITSDMYLSWEVGGNLTLNRVEHPLYEEDDDDDDNNGGNQGGDGEDDDNKGGTTDDDNKGTEQPGTYSISGTVWLDSNKNGEREESENTMSDLEVELLNSNTGESIKNTKTDSSGKYQFSNLEKGKYITVFHYNSATYAITQYQKQGIKEDRNSDVIPKEKDGKTVAMTDTLSITNQNLSHIDAGLIRNTKFDLSLDKTIRKVIVQNAEGTKQIEYGKSKLAKVEINSKYMNNTTVLVEYQIEVKNEGEIEGYISEIIDYMPKDLKFNSEINKDWYIGTDGNLHNVTLSNTVIKPNETKTLTLTLMKQMSTENTGMSVNIAEIAVAKNELSIADEDSTPGNRKDGEDDISKAELLISVKTGIVVISVSISIVLALMIIAYVIYRKRKGGKWNERKTN